MGDAPAISLAKRAPGTHNQIEVRLPNDINRGLPLFLYTKINKKIGIFAQKEGKEPKFSTKIVKQASISDIGEWKSVG